MNRKTLMSTKSKSLIIALFLICIFIYFNSLFCDFVFDDKSLIVSNPYIKDLSFISKVFSKDLYDIAYEGQKPNYYRPFQVISFMLDYRIWRLNPFGYHLTNILIHFFNSVLIYCIVYTLFKKLFLAAVSSFLFCTHPINTTTVAYISGRADLLVALFILSLFLCTILLIKYQKRQKLHFLLIILISIFALLSRENALLIPLIIFFLSFYLKGSNKYKVALLITIALVAYLFLLFRIRLLNIPILRHPLVNLNPYLKIINFLQIVLSYISLLVIPKNLHLMHTIVPIFSIWDMRVWLILIFFIILLFFFYLKRSESIFAFSISCFLIFLIPVFFSMTKFTKNKLAMSENWTYLSSFGFYIIISYWLYHLKKYFKIYVYSFVIIILFIFGTLTVINNINFKDDFTLSKYLLQFEPDNKEIYKELVSIYLEKKEYDKAIAHIKKSIEIEPFDSDLYILQGRYYEETGNTEMAISSYERLLKIIPNSGRANNNLGAIYFDKGNFSKAEEFFKKAIELNPMLFEPYLNMANLYYKNNHINDAIFFYKQVIKLNPDIKDTFINLGKIYIESKDFKQTINILNKAIAYTHTDPIILVMLGIANDNLGLDDKALLYFKEALKSDPKSQEAMLNVGIFYAHHNNFDKAIKIWEEALSINPDNEIIKENLRQAKELQNKR